MAVKKPPAIHVAFKPFLHPRSLFYAALWRYFGQRAGGKAKEEYPVSSLFYSVVKAYYDGIKKLPVMFSKRKAIQSKRAVSARDVKKWFSVYGISVTEIALKD